MVGRPNKDTSELNETLDSIDTYFLVIFVVEACMKLVADGAYWCGRSSYFRSRWNILDFFIVVAG